ncbi:MAG: alpha/beta fold hydrolase [Stackebrandtia sp.]
MTGTRKSTVLKTLFGAMAVAVTVTAVVQSTPATAQSAIDWSDCPGGGGDQGLECTRVKVPVDWDEPGGREISLLLGRLPATGEAKGTVVVNYGGPGGPAVGAMRDKPEVFDKLREDMNVVTWDYRGYPSLDGAPPCEQERLTVPPVPTDQREFDALAEDNRALAEECRDKDPELFDNMGSVSQARDMEAVREALGERRLNLISTSYGGIFAQTYARQFPDRIRTLVLDGTLDHGEPPAEHARNQARDDEGKLKRFFDWCAGDTACVLNGTDVPKRWQALAARADERPIPAPDADAEYTGWQLRQLAVSAAVRGQWEPLATAIRDAEDGDASGFAFTPDTPYPSYVSPGMTECQDFARPHDQAELESLMDSMSEVAPNAGATGPDLTGALVCVGWPAPVNGAPSPLPTGKLPPILAAGTWLEYDSLDRATSRIPGSTTIEYDGPGHALYVGMENDCVVEHANRYLVEGTLPGSGTVCGE